jgi:hypothetical protein
VSEHISANDLATAIRDLYAANGRSFVQETGPVYTVTGDPTAAELPGFVAAVQRVERLRIMNLVLNKYGLGAWAAIGDLIDGEGGAS